MTDDDSDLTFAFEEVEGIVKSALTSTLDSCAFEDDKADAITNSVIDSCLKGLQGLQRPFKFAGACHVTSAAGGRH